MLNKKTKNIWMKATVKNLIVAFIYIGLFIGGINLLFSKQINQVMSAIDLISVNTNKKILEDVKLDLTSKNLVAYPEYGTKYADIKIPSLNIDLPVYYGDTLSIIKKGVGHSSGSYFPGEGGSILYMGHNTKNALKSLKNIEENAEIIVTTTYGTYTYQVFETKVIQYTDLDQVPIQREEEMLMLYTCYQSTAIGHTPKRFMVYARLIESKGN